MLLPAGRREGREWVVGSVHGEEGRSCKVAVEGGKRGRFCDFAAGDHGDLLDLWCLVKGISIAEAVTEAKRYLGIEEPTFERYHSKNFHRPTAPKAARKVSEQSAVRSYLAGRGLNEDGISAYRLGRGSQEIGPWPGWARSRGR